MKTRSGPSVAIGFVICVFAAAASADPPPQPGGKPAGAGAPTAPKAAPGGDKTKGESAKGSAQGNAPEKGKPESAQEHGKPGGEEHAKGEKPEGEPGKPEAPPGLEAKDDEHHKILLARFEERRKTAPDRAKQERDNIRRRWAQVLDRAPVQDELRRHAMTVARLHRIKEIAEVDGKSEMSARATAAAERENSRHEQRMSALAAQGNPAGAASGGAP
jgi:hypothetical protein